MKIAKLGAALIVSALVADTPATAQVFGPTVVACVADSEDAIKLGSQPTPLSAWRAARTHRIKNGQYAVATINGKRVAIDSEGVIHPVSEDPCYGSGQRMKPPQEN